jgi:hypothetical protein
MNRDKLSLIVKPNPSTNSNPNTQAAKPISNIFGNIIAANSNTGDKTMNNNNG